MFNSEQEVFIWFDVIVIIVQLPYLSTNFSQIFPRSQYYLCVFKLSKQFVIYDYICKIVSIRDLLL